MVMVGRRGSAVGGPGPLGTSPLPRMFVRGFAFRAQSEQKILIGGNRFLAAIDFPLGYVNPLIGARALAYAPSAGFERFEASLALSQISLNLMDIVVPDGHVCRLHRRIRANVRFTPEADAKL